MSTSELQPDIAEVLQTEEPEGKEPTVKVTQQGPVRTQALPRKSGSTKTVQATTARVTLLRPNPRRASALIISDAPFYFAFTLAAAQIDTTVTTTPPTMALWPANVPLPMTSADTYAVVAAKTGTAGVSAVVEYWAAGEGED